MCALVHPSPPHTAKLLRDYAWKTEMNKKAQITFLLVLLTYVYIYKIGVGYTCCYRYPSAPETEGALRYLKPPGLTPSVLSIALLQRIGSGHRIALDLIFVTSNEYLRRISTTGQGWCRVAIYINWEYFIIYYYIYLYKFMLGLLSRVLSSMLWLLLMNMTIIYWFYCSGFYSC